MISFRGIELQTTKWQSYKDKNKKYRDLQSYEISKLQSAKLHSILVVEMKSYRDAKMQELQIT